MTPEHVETLATSGESEMLEIKATTGTRREATATLCAMLNQRGGHILFGIAPNGQLVGQQVSEQTIEQLSAELGRIDPPVFPNIERVRVDGELEVIVVHVNPGPTAQHRTATAAPPIGASAIRLRSCPPKNITAFSSIACTTNGAGRTRQPRVGQLTISI